MSCYSVLLLLDSFARSRSIGKFFINRVLEILLKTKGGRARGGGWVPLLLTVSTTNVGTVPHPRRDLLQVLY